MTEHKPDCASLRLLLSHPPQTQECDCGAARAQVSSLIKGGRPKVVAFPGCAAPVGDSENPGGTPGAPLSVADELRELARKLDAGEVEPLKALICVPVDEVGVDCPYLMGVPMSSAEVIGRLEICKAAVLDFLWVAND